MDAIPAVGATLEQIPARLRRARERKALSLAQLSDLTGISTSTLSRLEVGKRKPSLELLLPISAALAVPLDELVAPPRVVDPRVPQKPHHAAGRTFVPLTRERRDPQAFKLIIPPKPGEPTLRTHGGYEWLFVLQGRLRLRLGEQDLILGPGEVAEFDTQVPHWFGPAGNKEVELLSLFSPQGERLHVRTSGKR